MEKGGGEGEERMSIRYFGLRSGRGEGEDCKEKRGTEKRELTREESRNNRKVEIKDFRKMGRKGGNRGENARGGRGFGGQNVYRHWRSREAGVAICGAE